MDQPWLQHYDEGVPAKIGDYPAKTLVDFVKQHASDPARVALLFMGRRISYAELDRWSDALARAFKAEGLERGDRIAVVLPNCPQFLIAELATWKLGAILAPQNPIYTARELQESLTMTAPKLVVTLTAFYHRVKQAFGGSVIATNIKEYLPPLLNTLFTIFKEKKEGHRITLEGGDVWLQELLTRPDATPVLPVCTPDDPAIVLMSGGTTGTPKGALSDHRSLVMAGTQLSYWLHEPLDAPDASIMLPLPLFHTYGCAGAQSLSIIRGIPLVLVPNPRDLDDVVKTIERDRPTLLCGVPTLFIGLLNHRAVKAKKVDFSSIRVCFSGAAALMAETKNRFESLTGGRIVEGYSLTEATMACCANPYRGVNKTGSVGMPLPDIVLKIVDSEEGTRELPTNQVGEVLMHAPQLMRNYWGNASETAQAVRDGWLYTGDLGYLDDDGYLFLVDRKKDLIKTSGFQVWPREIEEVISMYPTVAEVGAAGLPDEKRGEVVVAWVVPRPGELVEPEAVRDWCRERLAPYKVPVRIEIRRELPKTMIGKVLRRELVAQATGRHKADV